MFLFPSGGESIFRVLESKKKKSYYDECVVLTYARGNAGCLATLWCNMQAALLEECAFVV